MLRYPNIDPIALSLGPLHIHWYGVMYLLGFAAAWWLARRRAAQPGSSWSAADVDDFLFYAMLGVILGGRIGYVLFYGMPLWRGDWLYPLKIWEGGMSFHGGMLGVLTAACDLRAASARRHAFDVYDFAAPLPGVGLFFGRLGNFINGELWGRPDRRAVGDAGAGSERRSRRRASSLAAVRGDARGPGAVHRSCGCFTSRPRPRYAPSGLFLICYSIARILVEFVREPDVRHRLPGVRLADHGAAAVAADAAAGHRGCGWWPIGSNTPSGNFVPATR